MNNEKAHPQISLEQLDAIRAASIESIERRSNFQNALADLGEIPEVDVAGTEFTPEYDAAIELIEKAQACESWIKAMDVLLQNLEELRVSNTGLIDNITDELGDTDSGYVFACYKQFMDAFEIPIDEPED